MSRSVTAIAIAAALFGAGLGVSSCGGGSSSSAPVSSKNYPLPGHCDAGSCVALSGSPWIPNVAGMAASNHDGTVTVSRTTITQAGVPLTGLGQPAPASQEVSVTIDMSTDLGPYGSLTLEAKVKNFASGLYGNAFPVLVSLTDDASPPNDYINLERSGAAGDCASAGYYSCSGGVCYANSGCSVQWPSAFHNRLEWEQHQVTLPDADSDASQSYPSVNVFPTCNWTVPPGSPPPTDPTRPECAFNSTFFPSTGAGYPTPRLRYGGNYIAKYVLLTNSYATVNDRYADLEVTVVKKTDANAGGAIDLNVILVGSKNVQASRTPAGQRNLDTLFTKVYNFYNQSGTGVQLGSVNAIEFPCDQCGDYYSDIPTSDLSYLYMNTGSLISSSTQGKAVNLYMVSTLPESNSAGFTILGMAGGIGGPVSIPNPIGGVSFSSFNNLDKYNPLCSTGPCPDNTLDRDFAEFSETIAHELGHYLGLNHPSESDGQTHDSVDDTPICTATNFSGYISLNSCRLLDTNAFQGTGSTCSSACSGYNAMTATYCPTVQECQFNHIMWWTTKNWDTSSGTGDGALFSPHTGGIINYSSFIQ